MNYIGIFKKLTRKSLLALLLAAVVTVVIGIYVPPWVDAFNDAHFGDVTILDKPELVDALRAAQDDGVWMALHGYHHEDYRLLDAEKTRELVEKGLDIVEKAGLTASVWYTPYTGFRRIPSEVQEVILSYLPQRLPDMDILDLRGDEDDVLEDDEVWFYSGTYTVTQDMIDSNGNGEPVDGIIHDTLVISSDQGEAARSSFSVAIAQTPCLEVMVTADDIDMTEVAPDDRIDAGDSISYTILVYNTGTENLTDVRVADSLPSRLRRVVNSWSRDVDDVLGVGEDWEYTATYTVTQDMIDSNGNGEPVDGNIYNTVIVSTDQTQECTNSIAVPITKTPYVDLTFITDDIDMTVAEPDDRLDAGDTISYEVTIHNIGNQPLTNIIVSDSLMTPLERGTSLNTRPRSFTEYTEMWRDMESFDDPRYAATLERLLEEKPLFIMAHFYDWNIYSKQLITEYLAQTTATHIDIRVDDVEPNTPAWTVTSLAELLDSDKVVRLSYGVIPEGTFTGGDAYLAGVAVNDVFRFYWLFFLIVALFPFLFLVFWRILSIRGNKPNGNGNGGSSSIGPDGNGGSLTIGPKDKGSQAVSLIVPAYNEEEHIADCLEAIQKQDFSGDIEVIVVNDGSSDRTAEIASKYPVKLVNLPENMGKANALNAGIAHSKGDIVIFSDSDSEVGSDSISRLVNCMEANPDASAVAGNVYIKKANGKGNGKGNMLKCFQMIEYRVDQGLSRYLQGLGGNVLVCPGPLFAIRREVAEEVMFSNRTVIEDADFTVELLKNNRKVYHEPQAKVYTNPPRSLKAWIAQRKRWMYGTLQVWRIHRRWAIRNPWMLFNYSGFITATVALLLLVLLPFLFLSYDSFTLALLRGMAYAVVPALLFSLLIFPFIRGNIVLWITLIPYTLLYGILKAGMLSYIYARYIFHRGMTVKFGPRTIFVK